MKKLIKLSILMLTIFFANCEKDRDNMGLTEEETPNTSLETYVNQVAGKNNYPSSANWKIIGFQGPYTWIRGEHIPHLGSYIIAEGTHQLFLGWVVDGCFKIEGSASDQKVRILRTSRAKGSVTYLRRGSNNGIIAETLNFIPIPQHIPDPIPCPVDGHTAIQRSLNTLLTAQNYNNKYTYSWKIVHNGRTSYRTGRDVLLMRGNSTVTLSVSMAGCPTKTGNPNHYYIR